MKSVDAAAVEAQLAELLAQAEAGERIAVMRDGHRVAGIVPANDMGTLEFTDWAKAQATKRLARSKRNAVRAAERTLTPPPGKREGR